MSFLAFTGLINFITCSFFGVYVLIKKPKGTLNILYFLVNLSIAVFSIGYFFWQLSNDIPSSLLWFKVLMTGVILINPTFLFFVFVITSTIKKKKIELIIYYLINIFFLILNLNLNLYSTLETRYNLGFWPEPTKLFHIYLVCP